MKMSKAIVGSVLAVLVAAGVSLAADREQFTVTKLTIGETPVLLTETIISNIVSGVVSGTGTLLSNATLKVYGQTSVVTGNETVGGTLAVAGASQLSVQSTVREVTATRVCTSADYGKLVILATNAAIAVTLPANGAAAGSYIDFCVGGQSGIAESDACAPTISAATADTLRGPNDVDLKSVTWGSGHRIGASARFISDGYFWRVQNLGGTTMTYTD